jgi:hypothetical protein
MDATFITITLSLVAYTALLVGGFWKIIRALEKSLREEMTAMHAIQDARIREAELDTKEIRNNYIRRFEKVHEAMHSIEIKITDRLTLVESNLRDSHHTLADNVTKALAKLELLIKGIT